MTQTSPLSAHRGWLLRRLHTPALLWRAGLLASAAVLGLLVLSLAPHLSSSTELVRMRNALVVADSQPAQFDWTPANVPADFFVERGRTDPMFADVVARLGLTSMTSEWDRAIAISRHLLVSSRSLSGGTIDSDLRGTYSAIIGQGKGYCSDFVQVFMALAISADVPVRAWAFSFDGFGGHGHTWPEVWDRQTQRWQLIDVFNNAYFIGPQGVVLSALELRAALQTSPASVRLMPVDAAARPGWKIERKAWDYYQRGLPEWYLWWGANVFSYDRNPLVRSSSGVSASLQQLAGIAHGVQPQMRILESPENRDAVEAIRRLKIHLLMALALGGVAALALLACTLGWWRARGLTHRRRGRDHGG